MSLLQGEISSSLMLFKKSLSQFSFRGCLVTFWSPQIASQRKDIVTKNVNSFSPLDLTSSFAPFFCVISNVSLVIINNTNNSFKYCIQERCIISFMLFSVFKCLLKMLAPQKAKSHWLHLFTFYLLEFSPPCVLKCFLKALA